jgi:cytochrome P450
MPDDPYPVLERPQTTRGARAQQALSEYLDRAIATRGQQPGPDLISSMITANEGEESMSDAEIQHGRRSSSL